MRPEEQQPAIPPSCAPQQTFSPRPNTHPRHVRHVARVLWSIAEVLAGPPITAHEFRLKYGDHMLGELDLIPWVRVERSSDRLLRLGIDEGLRALCALHLLRPRLTLIVEQVRLRRAEHGRWCKTQWVTRVTELIALVGILDLVEKELAQAIDENQLYSFYVRPLYDELHLRRSAYWDSINRQDWLSREGNLDRHHELVAWAEAELTRLLEV